MTQGELKQLYVINSVKQSSDNPEIKYENLCQIGQGSFGCVYSAKSIETEEIIAIKKINLKNNKQKEKLREIEKELNILGSLCHENCIKLIELFYDEFTVWLIMEYCVGSVYNLIQTATLDERHIAYIAHFTLKALDYIHKIGFIHRDIKADNILITDRGVIKLADFGSASIKPRSLSFVGSPYWLAPEIMLAFDTNEYNQKVDIWSFGITCIEMAEKKPPLDHLNPICVMYNIVNDPPPRLSTKFSPDFCDFTNSSLQFNPDERPPASELLDHLFLNYKFNDDFLSQVLYESARIVEKDNARDYKNVKKAFSDSLSENSETRNNNIEIHDSQSTTTPESETSSIGGVGSDDSRSQKINTIKSAPNIVKEIVEYQQESYLQIKQYQALRKANNKQLILLETKYNTQLNEILRNSEKNIEIQKSISEKSLNNLREKYELELDKIEKDFKDKIKKMNKNCKNFSSNTLTTNSLFDTLKRVPSFSKKPKTTLTTLGIPSLPDFSAKKTSISFNKNAEEQDECFNTLKANYIDNLNALKNHYANEKIDIMINNRKVIGKSEIDEISSLVAFSVDRIEQIYKLKKSHLEKIHNFETQTLKAYISRKTSELEKRQLLWAKNKSKEHKMIEIRVTKLFKEKTKKVQNEFKVLLRETLEKSAKNQHSDIKSRMRNEKTTRLLALNVERESQILSEINKEKLKLNESQIKEKNELDENLLAESASLKNNQKNQSLKLDQSVEQEKKEIIEKYRLLQEKVESQIQADINDIKSQSSICQSDKLGSLFLDDFFNTIDKKIDSASEASKKFSDPLSYNSLRRRT